MIAGPESGFGVAVAHDGGGGRMEAGSKEDQVAGEISGRFASEVVIGAPAFAQGFFGVVEGIGQVTFGVGGWVAQQGGVEGVLAVVVHVAHDNGSGAGTSGQLLLQDVVNLPAGLDGTIGLVAQVGIDGDQIGEKFILVDQDGQDIAGIFFDAGQRQAARRVCRAGRKGR